MATDSIGGYLGLDRYCLPMLHEEALPLNCGRNCLAYIIRARKIKKIALPLYLCDSVKDTCMKEGVDICYYNIDERFRPVNLKADEWLYLVNYYGQFSTSDIEKYYRTYGKIIVDNAQSYFTEPVQGVDTLYTCRKFFGVTDGAFLYTDVELNEEIKLDESYNRMLFVYGRYERPASEFYDMYVRNNELFNTEPIKQMSRLTTNLLHGIEYEVVKNKRTYNYNYLHKNLKNINKLQLKEIEGAFAYPLLVDNGAEIRKQLISEKIYIPMLWPNVLEDVEPESLEYRYAENILPLPCDQRYGENEMKRICDLLEKVVIKR
jgi:hypothetical protein